MTVTAPRGWQTLPVLMYHSVSAAGGPLRDLAVPAARLAEHLAALTGAGYRLVGLAAALDLLDAGSPQAGAERMVAVTFDDGYRNFLTAGVPALAEAGAGATLYASAGHLGEHAGWLGRWAPDFGRLLTWEELVEVGAAGIEVANHGWRHHPLDVLPHAQLRAEIRRSRDELEQRLQTPMRGFAYPHGYHDRHVRDAVRQTGHDHATEVGRRRHTPADRRFAVPRLQPTPDMTGADLVALVAGGGPALVPRVKRLAQPGWRVVRRIARRAGKNLT
ncbi:polysaccharide deacetylase family protein [Mangrovihabitans endophyticus]|uniref:Polysaccharide deacetylase n=1 Tax=Mangrovihabitans endophyticus TaxID=1751298 RepID=A0A8J3C0D8_9ACTN|nr:polysaccharide deacetylase family protein [Mangrovihabitans endophyticus]GGK91515.1 polysaccharide deacetylase [Mangrovihabitans endophyticus]